ncbi:MAG: serine/threonine protein kinase [Pirellulales bacterium]|nr:serine/threonine protein kinase [Pirellulales bacterium]
MSDYDRPTFEHCAIASGLLNREQIDEARTRIRWSQGDEADPGAPPSDKQLAERLVEMGLLNAWQAKQLLDGRRKFNLEHYWIIDSLGQGGMGQVFKARDAHNDRIVAVKVLPRHKSTPEAIENFSREIQAMKSMNHAKLVAALDAGHDGNVHFLVTEYVPGVDLRKLIRRTGPLGMTVAANVIYQVAEGLAHAHAQGIIHRDVKPGNVLVTPEGEVKLSDLGLAGPLETDAENDPRHGKIVGTADYLSPDQLNTPGNPTPGWDIYALGCTLYYAVTGKVPFPGGGVADKVRAHLALRPLDPRRLNPRLTAEFVDALADMMDKDPAQRLPSAQAVMDRLRPWLPGGPKADAATGAVEYPSSRTPPVATPPPVVPPQLATPPMLPSRPPVAARIRSQESEGIEDTKSDFPELPRATDGSESDALLVLPPGDAFAEEDSSSREIPTLPAENEKPLPNHPLGFFLILFGICAATIFLWLLVKVFFL